MPRKYTKKNQAYWAEKSLGMSKSKSENSQESTFEPQMMGEPLISFEESKANRLSSPNERTKSRTNRVTSGRIRDKFTNIQEGILPYDYTGEYVSIKDAIVLTQKAYFNIPVFKYTLDLLSEFANTEVYLKGGDKSSRKFVEAWLKVINLYDLKDQFFREYFRSGNVFLYELRGKLTKSSVRRFAISSAAEKKDIPVKYLLLNPADIVVNDQLRFGDFSYAKALTPFEITRLKERKTEEAKKMFEGLPEDVQKQLKADTAFSTKQEILLPLEFDLIHPVFYKKQDYEPLAVPMGFSVLDDINKKQELKKVDQAIIRSIENVILLVTMGAEPDKGGVNHKNIAAMQSIFENKSVGRVLVSDHTTKADFVMPDLKKVMGKEKYEVLNRDIEEGLSNILLGESKYADTELKLKIFFERLSEVRERFLRDFLQKNINKVCKSAGFRNPPSAAFVKKDTITNEDLQKLATRMMELGIIAPEQGMDVINKGRFPEAEEMTEAQEKYLKEREKGHYLPMVLSQTLFDTENESAEEELQPTGTKEKTTVSAPTGGRPMGTASSKFSLNGIKNTIKRLNDFESKAQAEYRKKSGIKRLNKDQKKLISDICSSIACDCESKDWDSKILEIIDDNSALLNLGVSDGVLSIAAEHGLDDYSAAILYHSDNFKDE
mgnify:CR=1 FL=1